MDHASLEDRLTPKTILLVDDDPHDVLLVQQACRKAKLRHEIQVVHDGERAIAYLAGTGSYHDRTLFPYPVLVLLDLDLPKHSGLEVLTWIRRHAKGRRLSVVIFTSSHESDDIHRAYDLGANSYLLKPVDVEALVHVVKMLEMYWIMLIDRPGLG